MWCSVNASPERITAGHLRHQPPQLAKYKPPPVVLLQRMSGTANRKQPVRNTCSLYRCQTPRFFPERRRRPHRRLGVPTSQKLNMAMPAAVTATPNATPNNSPLRVGREVFNCSRSTSDVHNAGNVNWIDFGNCKYGLLHAGRIGSAAMKYAQVTSVGNGMANASPAQRSDDTGRFVLLAKSARFAAHS